MFREADTTVGFTPAGPLCELSPGVCITRIGGCTCKWRQ